MLPIPRIPHRSTPRRITRSLGRAVGPRAAMLPILTTTTTAWTTAIFLLFMHQSSRVGRGRVAWLTSQTTTVAVYGQYNHDDTYCSSSSDVYNRHAIDSTAGDAFIVIALEFSRMAS